MNWIASKSSHRERERCFVLFFCSVQSRRCIQQHADQRARESERAHTARTLFRHFLFLGSSKKEGQASRTRGKESRRCFVLFLCLLIFFLQSEMLVKAQFTELWVRRRMGARNNTRTEGNWSKESEALSVRQKQTERERERMRRMEGKRRQSEMKKRWEQIQPQEIYFMHTKKRALFKRKRERERRMTVNQKGIICKLVQVVKKVCTEDHQIY